MPIEGFSEDDLTEAPAMEELQWLGWKIGSLWTEFANGVSTEGRMSRSDPVLPNRLHAALKTLNPDLPEEALQQAALLNLFATEPAWWTQKRLGKSTTF